LRWEQPSTVDKPIFGDYSLNISRILHTRRRQEGEDAPRRTLTKAGGVGGDQRGANPGRDQLDAPVSSNGDLRCKRQLLGRAAGVFCAGRNCKEPTEEELTAPLYEQIERLCVLEQIEKRLGRKADIRPFKRASAAVVEELLAFSSPPTRLLGWNSNS